MSDLKEIESKMQEVYEQNAMEFDQQRSKALFEKKWLDKFLGNLSKGDEILDIGCGSAEPIAKYLIDNDLDVTGVDYSHSMIAIAKKRYPQFDWIVEDMRKIKLNKSFKGIIAWNSFFHLNQHDQRQTIEIFSSHLCQGGIFMTTVGPESGEVGGKVNNKDVYHSSLSIEEYTKVFLSFNMEVIEFVPNDIECNEHSVLMAIKK